MRRMIVPLALALAFVSTAQAADLTIHRRAHIVRHANARPWCVITRPFLGPTVWHCAPTLADCHVYEVPGTSLYCIRDPIWRGPTYLAAYPR
jgi:hypothetical protein